ncbi:MAG: GAF domain-containing protein [Cyanobacteria bacterium P01_A01_bin.37]
MTVQKAASAFDKHLVILGRSLQALREATSENSLIDAVVDYLRTEFNYALVWLGVYDAAKHTILGRGGFTPSGDTSLLTQNYKLEPGDIFEQVVVQQRLVGVPDLREEMRAGRWRKAAQKHSIQGSIIFPLRHQDKCLGVAFLGSTLWGVSPQSEEKSRLSILFGELAFCLYQHQVDRQHEDARKTADPLLTLLNKLRSLPTIDKKLELIAQEIHQFTKASHTNIYWFEPENRFFWLRASQSGNRMGSSYADRSARSRGAEIPVQEINSFYQAMTADQLISISEVNSALKTGITGRLMHYVQGQSVLATPILFQEELIGFIAISGDAPRIWSEDEKTFMRAATQLVGLVAPLENPEQAVTSVKHDQALVGEVARAIYSSDDWKKALESCAENVCTRLNVERFVVLTYNRNQETFIVAYQNPASRQRMISQSLAHLNEIDWQMIERSHEAVGIEDLEEDLKLMAWRDMFLDLGLRSLLVCNTSIGNPLEGLVLVGHDSARTWNRSERDILRAVSQQIGLILRQWQLHNEMKQQEGFHQAIEWGLLAMQQSHHLDQLEQTSMQNIANLLEAPLATLISWQPGRQDARVVAAAVTDNKFALASDVVTSVHTDLLIQGTLATDSVLALSVDHLAPDTRQWLSGSGIGQILAMALRTAPEHEPTGIIIVADVMDRFWSERQLTVMEILGSQLAWARRYLILTETLTLQREKLERLNWYKQRRIEEFCRSLTINVRRLNELSHQKDALASMRYHQIIRQLGQLLTTAAPVLKREHWRLHTDHGTMPLVTLLKRAMERVESLIKQRQLWSQVHNDSNLSIEGDISKLEFILYELLSSACRRSPTSGRIDIWCRPLDFHWLELSITDHGIIETRLLEELHEGRPEDLLVPSALEAPPGLHIGICQALMQEMGGECNLYRLEDGRTLSRMILAIAHEGAQATERSPIPKS